MAVPYIPETERERRAQKRQNSKSTAVEGIPVAVTAGAYLRGWRKLSKQKSNCRHKGNYYL